MTPAIVRAMTPDETGLLIAGWNEAQKAASGEVAAPTRDQVEDLIARYG